MSVKKLLLIVIVLGLGVACLLWLRREPAYVNDPPRATGPWVAFGDSLTEGYGASPSHDYPSLLSQRLGVPITNLGKSGDTSSDGLVRLEEVLRLHPRVVLLCFGGNDFCEPVTNHWSIARRRQLCGPDRNSQRVLARPQRKVLQATRPRTARALCA